MGDRNLFDEYVLERAIDFSFKQTAEGFSIQAHHRAYRKASEASHAIGLGARLDCYDVTRLFRSSDSLASWSVQLKSFSRPELRKGWDALTGDPSEGYCDEQIDQLEKFRRALRRRGISVEMPPILQDRFYHICENRSEEAEALKSSLEFG